MTLLEFIAECSTDIRRFHNSWMTARATQPELYPLDMAPGDWFDQYLTFLSSEEEAK